MIEGIDIEIKRGYYNNGDVEYILKLKGTRHLLKRVIKDKVIRKNMYKMGGTLTVSALECLCKDKAIIVSNKMLLCGIEYKKRQCLFCMESEFKQYINLRNEDLQDKIKSSLEVFMSYTDLEYAEKAKRIILENSY